MIEYVGQINQPNPNIGQTTKTITANEQVRTCDTKALAKELGPSGIRVNCVAPGVVLTDMCATVEPAILAEMAEETPVGRNGTPEDIAKAIEYLASAEFVTGQILPVNGGYVI